MLTGSTVQVIEVTNSVFIRAIAGLAIEAWLTWASTAWVLHDHGLSKVFVELQGTLAGLHELRRLWYIVLSTLSRLLACLSVRC